MSSLTNVLAEEVRKIEETAAVARAMQTNRLTHHLMPPVGWLNDPNGLCWYKGRYHVFFQYSPFEANGGLKFWGHYSSEDMISWRYEGVPLLPDSIYDCHGVYSGSAIAEKDKLHLFYTGNIKMDGDYDYINNGRQSSTLHVESADGVHFGTKEVAVSCENYPENYTCHIRDPKVWKDGDTYRMVLGGRKKGDHGAVLFYRSPDLKNWEFDKELTTEDAFGYMWECPDVFDVGGHRYLSVSPQGLRHGETKFQNVYQSGYFRYDDSLNGFTEWDHGFDFYAPQTFETPDGRRIIIGWMGIGDIPYTNPTIELGYQHCLTVPREITADENGVLMQNPIRELSELRGAKKSASDGDEVNMELPSEIISKVGGEFSIEIKDVLTLSWEDGIFELRFDNDKAGGLRKVRRAVVPECCGLRIIADKSSLEIYLNDGRTVLSTRMYPEGDSVEVVFRGINAEIFKLRKQEVKFLGE